ncbi:MAG: AAA family ATPase, partial [Desulfovibrio sp.]|nr:AAA family ATPase [Desulfovibrio sp.]
MNKNSAGLPPALMIQGVASNAGKSLLVASICRLLARRWVRVAPFKAQNMPTSHTGSQIVVMGRPVGQMNVRKYVRYKPQVWKWVRRVNKSLAADAEVMVLEGAGSPAKINLRACDIVNMRMARYAGARVLLVADIDRGGAFAALIGTINFRLGAMPRLWLGAVCAGDDFPDRESRPDVNVIAELRHLYASGLAEALLRLAYDDAGEGYECTVVGICGGLQMMGLDIADPLGLESGGRTGALGLLP